MVKRILKLLPFKDICHARQICKRWKEIVDKGNLVKDAAENITCIIRSGGEVSAETVEVLFGDFKTKKLTNLPQAIASSSMVLHDGAILLSGGYPNAQKCLQLDHGTWK